MHLHEYQAKRLLASYKIPVPHAELVKEISEIEKAVSLLKGSL